MSHCDKSVPHGCNTVETRLARALISLKPAPAQKSSAKKNKKKQRRYNIRFLCFNVCPSLRVIMCCNPHRFAVRAATHHTRAWQTLKHGKGCFMLSIKHDFPFINIRKVPREVLKTEGWLRPRFSTPPSGPCE